MIVFNVVNVVPAWDSCLFLLQSQGLELVERDKHFDDSARITSTYNEIIIFKFANVVCTRTHIITESVLVLLLYEFVHCSGVVADHLYSDTACSGACE